MNIDNIVRIVIYSADKRSMAFYRGRPVIKNLLSPRFSSAGLLSNETFVFLNVTFPYDVVLA